PEAEDRTANVQELIAGAHEFDARLADGVTDDEVPEGATALDLFLQKVALITDVDRHDAAAEVVTLMTLHNAKGLEYPVVFIGGLEDGLFPLARAFDEPDELEEERRLFYVGITRAERKLYLSHARMRRRAGDVMPGIPSSFLVPIPEAHVERHATAAVARTRMQGGSRWGGASQRHGTRRAEPVPEYDGLVIDYSDAQEVPRFVKGERVRHPRFGRGTIRELTGFGRELKAVVEFESVGRKRIMLQYANLQKEL
ncbi:MAG: 3'-5' exonuclease, partial [Longimicrobiales bacterium]